MILLFTFSLGFAFSWLVMLVWIGVVTIFIDMVGVMMGWWTDDTFLGVPKR